MEERIKLVGSIQEELIQLVGIFEVDMRVRLEEQIEMGEIKFLVAKEELVKVKLPEVLGKEETL